MGYPIMIIIGIISSFIGACLALIWVSRDKTLVVLKEDETIVKKDELAKLVKGYAYAARKIDPELADEFK